MNKSKVEYSFVVAIYNDAYLAPAFCKEFEDMFKRYLATDVIAEQVELIFVNDGSRDDSLKRLKALPVLYPFVKIIDLSRNFGQHLALACGFNEAAGNFVGRLNVDMQDPPREIPRFLDVLKSEDVDLVVGQYPLRQSNLVNKFTAYLFFVAFNWLTGQKVPQNTSPLRVMNRRFVDAYNQIREKTRFPQGLESWLGFRHKYIPVTHMARADNRSSYTLWKRLKLGTSSVIAFSDRPLKIMVCAGFIIMFLGFLLALNIAIRKLLFKTILQGYASMICLITCFSGLQVVVIGITGLYVGRILQEVQIRPSYIVRERVNFYGKDQ